MFSIKKDVAARIDSYAFPSQYSDVLPQQDSIQLNMFPSLSAGRKRARLDYLTEEEKSIRRYYF